MHFDYSGWGRAPAKGIRGGNHNFLMGALFYDVEYREDLAQYVLSAEAYQNGEGKWFPSAYQIVVYASDEYDAMLKLVGNMEQWDRLKELEWFATWLERALREQEARLMCAIRQAMIEKAVMGDNQAARTILAIDKDTKKKPVGRPKGSGKKEDPKTPPKEDNGDASRILGFKR